MYVKRSNQIYDRLGPGIRPLLPLNSIRFRSEFPFTIILFKRSFRKPSLPSFQLLILKKYIETPVGIILYQDFLKRVVQNSAKKTSREFRRQTVAIAVPNQWRIQVQTTVKIFNSAIPTHEQLETTSIKLFKLTEAIQKQIFKKGGLGFEVILQSGPVSKLKVTRILEMMIKTVNFTSYY